MVILFSSDPTILPKLRASVPPGHPMVEAGSWREFESRAPAADCSTVAIEWLHRDPVFPLLTAFKTRHPRHPLALVTRWEPESARRLKEVFVEEIIWFREADTCFAQTLLRLCAHRFNFVRCMTTPFEEAKHLPATLRQALAYACRAERAVASVKQLAAATNTDRRTLWVEWKRAVGPEISLRLQDFLHWLVLLRAVGLKTPGQSWAAVADQVGVSPPTLARFAKQHSGARLQELSSDSSDLVMRFRERVLGILLPSSDNL
jgi:hypothetical protein